MKLNLKTLANGKHNSGKIKNMISVKFYVQNALSEFVRSGYENYMYFFLLNGTKHFQPKCLSVYLNLCKDIYVSMLNWKRTLSKSLKIRKVYVRNIFHHVNFSCFVSCLYLCSANWTTVIALQFNYNNNCLQE